MPERKMSRKEFDALPLRQETAEKDYKDGQHYRDAVYPDKVLVWKAYPKGSETKGEWQMTAAEIKG